jgi:hypothetical protein
VQTLTQHEFKRECWKGWIARDPVSGIRTSDAKTLAEAQFRKLHAAGANPGSSSILSITWERPRSVANVRGMT